MKHITCIEGKSCWEVWDMSDKRLMASFDTAERAAKFTTVVQKFYQQQDITIARSFMGQLDSIPWTIEYSGEQWGWVIEDAEGRFIASVNTLPNAQMIRRIMNAESKEKHEYSLMLDKLIDEYHDSHGPVH